MHEQIQKLEKFTCVTMSPFTCCLLSQLTQLWKVWCHVVELTLHPCTEIDLCWKNKCGFEIHEFCGFLQGLKIPLCLSHWNGYWVNGIQRSFVLYIVRGEGSAVPPRLTERVTNYRLMLKITSKHTHLNNPSPVGIISCQEKNTKIESTVCFLFRWCMRLTSL